MGGVSFAPFWEFVNQDTNSTSSFIQEAHPCAKLSNGDKVRSHSSYLLRASSPGEGTDTQMGNYDKEPEEELDPFWRDMGG